jgi:hypothetical protein
MTDKKKYVTKEMVTQAWTGSIVGVLLFLVIFPAIFNWWGVWWTYILIGPISTTMTYYTQERIRCPYCQADLTSKSKVCPNCGVDILAECPSCHSPAQWGARFCDTCGTNLRDLAMKRRQEAGGVPTAPPAPANPDAKFCTTCGEQVGDGAKFCFRCGASVK